MLYPIRQLNSSYLGFLQDHPDKASAQLHDLKRFLVQRKCTFRDVPMPFLLKPNFISEKQTRALLRTVEKMSRILDKFISYYIANEDVRRIMKFPDPENELFSIEPGYKKPW